jgi:hypothetical protein
MMSFFEIPKGVLKRLDFYRSRFFWQGTSDKKKYRLAKWDILCRPKDQGCLGIIDLWIQNKCLLSKWLFKLLNKEGTWQTLLRNKYLSSKFLSQVQIKPRDSHFWKGFLKVREDILRCGTFKIKDGSQTRFWEDTWLGSKPLGEQFPNLYNIANYRHATVANVMNQMPLNISFRRALIRDKLIAWYNLVTKIANHRLSQGRDIFTWDLHQHGQFSVRSMYEYMINQGVPFNNKFIWKLKIPLKIKIFLWYLQRGVILTKDNLTKRYWVGSQKCCFCDCNETIKHLFFNCQHAKDIWRVVQIATRLTPPRSVRHMLGNWLTSIANKIKK